jgi:hypothetical protein
VTIGLDEAVDDRVYAGGRRPGGVSLATDTPPLQSEATSTRPAVRPTVTVVIGRIQMGRPRAIAGDLT